jgi:hypothetical protein
MGDALRAQEYLSASRTAAFVSFQLGRREILLLTLGPAGMGCLVSESRNRSVPGYAPVFSYSSCIVGYSSIATMGLRPLRTIWVGKRGVRCGLPVIREQSA